MWGGKFFKFTAINRESSWSASPFDDFHFDFQVLTEHIYSIGILCAKWNDDVSVLHSWFYEVVICRLHESVVLFEHINHSSTSLGNVSLNTPRESDVVRS